MKESYKHRRQMNGCHMRGRESLTLISGRGSMVERMIVISLKTFAFADLLTAGFGLLIRLMIEEDCIDCFFCC